MIQPIGPTPDRRAEQLHSYPPPTRRPFGFLALGLSVAAALLLGYLIGFVDRTHGPTGSQPSVTGRATPPGHASSHPGETPSPTSLRPKDFRIGIQILGRDCNVAGCTVGFRIHPSYVGREPLPEQGRLEVTYEVTGFKGGPLVRSFEVEDGRVSFDNQEGGTTPTATAAELRATVTGIAYFR